MGLDRLKEGTEFVITKVKGILSNPATAAAAAGTAGVVIGGVTAKVLSGRKKSSSRKKRSTSRRKNRKLKFGSKAYRKKYLGKGRHKHRTSPRGRLKHHTHRKRPSGKAIHYTSKGQPYIILASGKARFVSKRGARASKRRKGGRY